MSDEELRRYALEQALRCVVGPDTPLAVDDEHGLVLIAEAFYEFLKAKP